MAERVTMTQLAELAGLDVSTVSRALRGDDQRVSARTIDRVKALALHIGYLPDANAASLRSRRSYVIGMLVPDLTDVVLANLFEAVSTAATASGYLAVVASTRGSPKRRCAAVHQFLSRRVDGVIVADATLRGGAPEELAKSGTPFVMALRSAAFLPSVVVDDLAGGRLAAEHLLAAGHQALCVVGGPRNVSTVKGRIHGFVDTCRNAGVTVSSTAVCYGAFGAVGGYLSMQRLLEDGQRPSAVFAVNDYNAIGATHALKEYGAVVGRDVAVVGYNDISIGRFLETPLTTVRVDHGILGQKVVELLLGRMNGEDIDSLQLQPELVVRASSRVESSRRGGTDQPVPVRTARRAKIPSSS